MIGSSQTHLGQGWGHEARSLQCSNRSARRSLQRRRLLLQGPQMSSDMRTGIKALDHWSLCLQAWHKKNLLKVETEHLKASHVLPPEVFFVRDNLWADKPKTLKKAFLQTRTPSMYQWTWWRASELELSQLVDDLREHEGFKHDDDAQKKQISSFEIH